MKIPFSSKWIILWFTTWSVASMALPAKADVDELLAEINRKPAPERSKILVEGAQKERVVYYYGSTSLSDTQEVIRGFNQQYPFIEVRFTRLGGASVAHRNITSYHAHLHNLDGVSLLGTVCAGLAAYRHIVHY